MKRRSLLAGLLLTGPILAGCASGLSTRPYLERRIWPLAIRRDPALAARAKGPVLLVRTLRAAPGLDARGLQTLRADASVQTDFYEEWIVPPAQLAEDNLRAWLADSGMFAAVVAPGSRLAAELALEGELSVLHADPSTGVARAALSVAVIDQRPAQAKVLLQRSFAAEAPLGAANPADEVAAQRAALTDVLRQVEAALR